MHKLHGFSQSGNTFTEYWREGHNAMGEVPVLEDGSRRMSQSAAIMLYLARKHGRFGGASEDEQQEVLRWLFFDNHKFTSNFATYRFMHSLAPAAPDASVMKFLRGRIDSAFGIVNKHLSDRDYLVGEQPTIADFSLCGYLYFPTGESGFPIAEQCPAIAAWLERIKQVPGWAGPYELLPGERIEPRR